MPLSERILPAKFLLKRKNKQQGMAFWKKLFFLPTDSSWYVVINTICVTSSATHLYNAVAGNCTYFPTMKTALAIMDLLYVVDIILTFFTKYIKNLSFRRVNIAKRPLWLLILEIISILPIEIFAAQETYVERSVYCVLKLNRCLRMVKVCYFFRCYYRLLDDSIYVRIIEMCANMFVTGAVTYMVYCNLHCFWEYCNNFCNFNTISDIITKMTVSGFSNHPENDLAWDAVIIVTVLFTFFAILLITTVHVIIENIEEIYFKYWFMTYFKQEMLILKQYNLPSYVMKTMKNSFTLLWEKCGGFNEDKSFFRYIPSVMKIEVLLDISWAAFYHSNLFRNEDVQYLRYLATIVQQRFFMPGEHVFRRNEIKSKMVYVVSGTIQLLSEDDGESPIMSFCNGTCIGESTLLVSYASKNHVCCKTFCELYIIEKKDFIKLNTVYPDMYNQLRKTIDDRYEQAKYMKKLANYAKSLLRDTGRAKDTSTIIWIKNTLHRLMSVDKESTIRHEMQNIYLWHAIDNSIFDKMLFCGDYLDLLAIKERREAEKDTVFVKTSFPCILQPNSIIVYINEGFVIILTLVMCFLVPYMSFILDKTPAYYFHIVSFMTFYSWVDIYIQVSTGINTRHGMIAKIKSIALLKLKDMGFCLDIISSIPLEVFSTVILEKITDQNRARLRLNRLAKLWRIFQMFKVWEKKFNVNIIFIRYLKFSWIHFYITYFLCCGLIYLYPKKDIIDLLFNAVEMVTEVGIIQQDFNPTALTFLILDIVAYFLSIIMLSQIASGYIMKHLNQLSIQKQCNEIFVRLKVHKISEKYSQRAKRYLVVQDLHKFISRKKSQYHFIAEVPKFLLNDIMEILVSDFLKSHVFFQTFPSDCLREVCAIMKSITLPPNEVIMYAGDMSNNVYIVYEGIFKVYDAYGNSIEKEISERVINLLPAIFEGTAAFSYVTVTYCRVAIFKIKKLKQTLTKYPGYLRLFNDTVIASNDIRDTLKKYADIQTTTEITYLLKVRDKSFHYFGFKLKPDSYEEFDYFLPFDNLYPFAFIRTLLMRVTVMPNGLFIRIWEGFRCFFAVITSLLVFTPIVSTSHFYIIYFFDFTAYADVYLRMHMCYYDEKGILVKHPLKTAIHYITHGFLIDLIAVFPFKFVFMTEYKDVDAYFIAHINRLFQLHRYVQYIGVLTHRSIRILHWGYGLAYMPILLVAANFLGCLIIDIECQFGQYGASDDFTDGIKCTNDSVLVNSPFAKPINPWRAYLYGVYMFASILTTIGWQGFFLISYWSKLMVIFASYAGLCVNIIITAYILNFHIYRFGPILEFQQQMQFLKVFMRKIRVGRKLRKYAIEKCEKRWSNTRGESLQEVMTPLFTTLRVDILYDFYGQKAFNSSILRNKNKNFYRNILLYADMTIMLKGEYVCTVNEITRNFVILLDGIVEVLGSDGVQLTTMYPGSMFGNLENTSYSRLKVSIIAETHVELLVIPSKKFYKMLSYYMVMEKEFNTLRKMNISYIPNKKDGKIEKVNNIENRPSKSIFERIFDPNSIGIQTWKLFILIFTCYLGIMVDFYQLGSADFSFLLLLLQYSSDIFYTIHYLFRNRIAYEDDKGKMVFDRVMIRKKVAEQRVVNVMSLISIVPLDVLVLVYPFPDNIKILLFGLCRLNRLFRLIFVFETFATLNRKLNVNVSAVRSFYIFFWVSLFLSGVSAAIGLSSCSVELNIHPPSPKCTELHSISALNRTTIYIRLFYLTTNALTFTSQKNFYPQGSLLISVFIIAILIGQYLRAICIAQIFATVFESHMNKYLYKCVLRRTMFFAKTEDLSSSLTNRVKYYMTLLWDKREAILNPLLLQSMPVYLKDAILNDAFHHLLQKHPIFKHCHSDCKRQIIQKFKLKSYFVGDYIELQGTVNGTMYFLISGKVVIIKNVYIDPDKFEHTFVNNGFFGVLPGLYSRRTHKYSYRSVVINTFVAYLERESWIHILDHFPASKELIYEAAKIYKGY